MSWDLIISFWFYVNIMYLRHNELHANIHRHRTNNNHNNIKTGVHINNDAFAAINNDWVIMSRRRHQNEIQHETWARRQRL